MHQLTLPCARLGACLRGHDPVAKLHDWSGFFAMSGRNLVQLQQVQDLGKKGSYMVQAQALSLPCGSQMLRKSSPMSSFLPAALCARGPERHNNVLLTSVFGQGPRCWRWCLLGHNVS